MTEHVLQDPGEELIHQYDWTDWLGGDTVASSSASLDPLDAGATVTDLGLNGNVQGVKVSGLTRGHIYRLTFEVTTTTGAEIGRWSITIRCGYR